MSVDIRNIITKYIDNTISSGELDILISWRNESADNEKEFNEIKNILLLSAVNNPNITPYRKRTWERLKQKMEEEKPDNVRTLNCRQKSWLTWMQAASIILILSIGIAIGATVFSKWSPVQDQLANNIATPPDTVIIQSRASSKSEVMLPDGSKVWLNSNSEIKLSSDFKKNREVYLVGEAYFDVARHENNNFFYVHTSDIKVEVLGTEFNVKSYPEEGMIETTLEEGEIVLYKKGKSSDVKMTSLKPNQHASFIKKDGELHLSSVMQEDAGNDDIKPIERKEQLLITESIDTEKYTAWKDGHLIIDGEPFESFVKKLERWYDVEIEIKNERVKRLHFTANFKNETIEQALQALKIAHPFKYTFDVDKNLILIE